MLYRSKSQHVPNLDRYLVSLDPITLHVIYLGSWKLHAFELANWEYPWAPSLPQVPHSVSILPAPLWLMHLDSSPAFILALHAILCSAASMILLNHKYDGMPNPGGVQTSLTLYPARTSTVINISGSENMFCASFAHNPSVILRTGSRFYSSLSSLPPSNLWHKGDACWMEIFPEGNKAENIPGRGN